ncbi:hypothetical protein [Prescottella subtropica]|uniref:hypothetical protein n=1 Tax=Prescottella subtropica TaxID=2545757 RepID=UPI0010F4941B|nr:hypothetical protein [Prescottella subtropica]
MDWAELAASAAVGDLHLERGVANQCAQRCSELIEKLQWIRADTETLVKVEGLGILPSGIALAEKFSKKASGGDYSMDRALADHIGIVEQMRDTFLAIEARYAAAEDANTAAVVSVESQIG